jgi:hypothetical protein
MMVLALPGRSRSRRLAGLGGAVTKLRRPVAGIRRLDQLTHPLGTLLQLRGNRWSAAPRWAAA